MPPTNPGNSKVSLENESQLSAVVLGLGYIGLPTAVTLASCGIRTYGIDISTDTVETIRRGDSPVKEPGLLTKLNEAISSGSLTVDTVDSIPAVDFYLVAVPTPLKSAKVPDIDAVEDACNLAAKSAPHGATIIIESTIPPGTTANISNYLRKSRPDLLFAHVPERVLPGAIMEEIRTNDRIIGGVDSHSTKSAANLYRHFCAGSIEITDSTTAELTKLAENSFRDVNIAYANELSMLCHELQTSANEVIKLANRHPRVNILQPGVGVGGHCIAVDPYFLIDSCREKTHLIHAARTVNEAKPHWVAEQTIKTIERTGLQDVFIFGITFKPNVDDARETPVAALCKDLAMCQSVSSITVVDPWVDDVSPIIGEVTKPIKHIKDVDSIEFHDLKSSTVVLAVKHDAFTPLTNGLSDHKSLIDSCGLLNNHLSNRADG